MTDWLTLSLIVRIFAGGVALAFLALIIRVINSASNQLEWADLISTPSPNGARQHADWDKIGKGCGVLLCVWMPVVYGYSPKMDALGLAAVLGVVLLYLGGVSAYAATLRARQGTVTTVTAPAPDPAMTIVTQTPPITPKGAL